MSQAFVKEMDEQWLHEVQPTTTALLLHLTKENNGVRVYEKSRSIDKKTGREVIHTSNGFGYAKDEKGVWYLV